MLQNDNLRRLRDTSVPTTEGSFSSFVAFLRRQYPVIVFVLLLALALGVVYLFTAPTRYTGEAVLIIDTHKVQLFEQQSVVGDYAVMDSPIVDTQVEILRSDDLALKVITDLHLVGDPEFASPSNLVGTVMAAVSRIFGSNGPKSEYELTRMALAVFQDNLTIKRTLTTFAIEIYYVSLSAERAAQIANAFGDAYIVNGLEAKYESTKRAAVWLQDRLEKLRQDATAAERAAVDYRTKNNIVDSGGRLLNEQQMAELNSALIQTRSQVAEAQARSERVNDIIRAASSDPDKLATATVTDTLNNAVITRLRQQFLDMAAREHDWSARYGSQHLAAVNLRYQMREIRQSIADELQRIAETYKSDYEIAKSREGSIEKTLSEIVSQSQQTNQAQIILHDLDSAAQAYRALYDNFLQRYMESVQQQSFPITEARLITHAARPLKNSHPKVLLVAAISLAGGLMLAFGAAQLRDLSDRVVRTTSQVEAALQVNCIAVLPIVQGRIDPSRWSFADKVDESGTRTIARDDWSVMDDPFSRFAEGIRSIKVASDQIGTRKSTKVIGITSSVPKEGKSTVATALAQIIAYGGSRAILVDCDLRNPSLSRGLTPNAKSGLLEVISGRARLEDVIWTDPRTNLSVLPIVAKARLAHTSDILGSPPTKMLFDSLRERYDYVVVDLSPLAPVVDVRTTIKLVDSYLFVVEWGRTKIDVAKHALAVSRGVYDGLLGVVLNKVNINVLRRHEHNRGTYYAQYDYTEGSGVRVPSSSRRSAPRDLKDN